MPRSAYQSFDFIIASGFCAVTFTDRYRDNLDSKLQLGGPTRILATLDYVDPWYSYTAMNNMSDESRALESIAIARRFEIDGLMLFANDSRGEFVPRWLVESFSRGFFPASPMFQRDRPSLH